ncbi:MAG: aminotransferase class III-fold pyridoxal phosphate-dependent enzyme [Rhodobacteraceae bacterium]|nr:aminotransferase class III-fold pyridoxal phosphate-dependent enzyme [Paracoccaceae bacterium]
MDLDTRDLLDRRRRLMGPNVSTFYDNPVHIVRGQGVWLWDRGGTRYLDMYNNVAHVGHCHPAVVQAIATQAATLNTHTRYLHGLVLDLIENLAGRLGHDIGQAILTCTGSEANDVAIRMAQAATGKMGLIATDNTYHGNTAAVAQLNARRPPIGGPARHIRLVPAPDRRAPVGGSAEGQAHAFAAHVARAVADLEDNGSGFAGLILCPAFCNEGLTVLEPGFLAQAMAVVRRVGGLVIADEVQPGFGRLGASFWGHDWIGIAPDIVTMGKPMGNGHPVACAMAKPDIMAAFREAFPYFNTFGGNPVSAAAALAVLRVIDAEGLQENAARMGARLLKGLRALRHPAIADACARRACWPGSWVARTTS